MPHGTASPYKQRDVRDRASESHHHNNTYRKLVVPVLLMTLVLINLIDNSNYNHLRMDHKVPMNEYSTMYLFD